MKAISISTFTAVLAILAKGTLANFPGVPNFLQAFVPSQQDIDNLNSLSIPPAYAISSNDKNQFWFGSQNRSDAPITLRDDDLIKDVASWGIPWFLDQIVIDSPGKPRNESQFVRPSIEEYETKHDEIPHPAAFLLSCHNEHNINIQRKLNDDCQNIQDCTVSFYLYSVWATAGNMNFTKDGVLARTCGLLQVNQGCTFPYGLGCQIKFIEDFTDYSDYNVEGLTRIGEFNKIDQISHLLRTYGELTGQQLTPP